MHNPVDHQVPNLHVKTQQPFAIPHPHIALPDSPLPIMNNNRLAPPPPRIPLLLDLSLDNLAQPPTRHRRQKLDVVPRAARLNAAIPKAQRALPVHAMVAHHAEPQLRPSLHALAPAAQIAQQQLARAG